MNFARLRLSVLIAALAVCLSSRDRTVHAQAGPAAPSSPAAVSAAAHFEQGVELFKEGDHRAALIEFEKAYEISPDYRVLYNIGQAKLQTKDYLGAIKTLERYLADGGDALSESRREDVAWLFKLLRGRVGKLVIKLESEGVDVFVDDSKVGTSPLANPVEVNVGHHRVHAQRSDGASASSSVDVAGGEVVDVSLELTLPRRALLDRALRMGVDRRLPAVRKAAIVSWSVGGAFAVGAVVAGLAARSDQSELDKALRRAPVDPEKVGDLQGSLDKKALLTDVLAGVAIGAVAAGVVCWMAGKEAPGKRLARIQIEVGPTSLSGGARF